MSVGFDVKVIFANPPRATLEIGLPNSSEASMNMLRTLMVRPLCASQSSGLTLTTKKTGVHELMPPPSAKTTVQVFKSLNPNPPNPEDHRCNVYALINDDYHCKVILPFELELSDLDEIMSIIMGRSDGEVACQVAYYK